jgi:hypothetical protein
MRIRFYSEADKWTTEGASIIATEKLDAIRKTLENERPVIVEHWFYRGACTPERRVFDDFEILMDYLTNEAFAGDAIHVWSFSATCRDDNALAHGKCPDDQGRVPKTGAY